MADKKKLTEREKRFCEALLDDPCMSGTKAAEAAGYSKKSARQEACRILKKPEVIAYRAELAAQRCAELGITKDSAVTMAFEIYARCMEAKPHLSWDADEKKWLPDGDWIFDARGAVKALEVIARLLGFAEAAGGAEPPAVRLTPEADEAAR